MQFGHRVGIALMSGLGAAAGGSVGWTIANRNADGTFIAGTSDHRRTWEMRGDHYAIGEHNTRTGNVALRHSMTWGLGTGVGAAAGVGALALSVGSGLNGRAKAALTIGAGIAGFLGGWVGASQAVDSTISKVQIG